MSGLSRWCSAKAIANTSHGSCNATLTIRHLPSAATKTSIAFIDQWNFEFAAAADLLNSAGYYLEDRARYQEAEPLYQRALAIREQALGPDHPHTAKARSNYAALLRTMGRR